MAFLAWSVLGLVSGFLLSKLVNQSGEGFVIDVILGLSGALVGGWTFHTFGMSGITGANLSSMAVAVIGALMVLVLYHALSGRRI